MPILVLCAVFLASGAGALVFETVWFFQAGLGFGNGITASSIVLAGFMAGMALGGAAASRYGHRVRDGLWAYAVLEAVVAFTGVALTYLLPGVHRIVAPLAEPGTTAALFAVRAALAFALLAVPSTAIGMTLPILARALERRDANFGCILGLLYGVNTAGAVLGTLLTEHVLLESFGVRGTAWFAAALDVGAAAVAYRYARGQARAEPQASPQAAPAPASAAQWPWLLAAFGSGLILLALEVVWLRVLTLFLNDTPLAFATILALVLGGVAAGGLGASYWAARRERPHAAAPWLAYGSVVACLGGYLVYPVVLERYYAATQGGGLVFVIAAPLVLPTCLCSGALYVVLGAGLREAAGSHGAAAGRLSFANTLGAMLGSLLAGFVLLPELGMERSLFAALVAYGLVGLGLSLAGKLRPPLIAAGALACAVCLVVFPFGRMRDFFLVASAAKWVRPNGAIESVREGTTGTVVHIVHRVGGAPLFDQVASNAYSMTVNDFMGRRYMKLFTLLPEALHPRIRRAVVVGYGIGNTVESLLDDPDVERVDLADISRDLLEVSRGMLTRPKRPLDDPRVKVHIEDGRHFLATSREEYDLVTGEPPPPIIAGVVALYTQEYFEIVRSRLAPRGMATYWLPMMNISHRTAKAIIAAFCGAFADCSLWQGSAENFMLLGTRGATGPAAEDRFVRAFHDPGRIPELSAMGLELPAQLGATFVGDADYLRELTLGVPPLTDDWPRRIQQEGTKEERDQLVAQFQDTKASRARFASSELVRRLWPPALIQPTLSQFENERLLDDLMSRKPHWARSTKVLHQVLNGTPLRLPVLLILKSTPDVQRVMRALPEAERQRPEWLPHRIAERLAERDFRGALELLSQLPKEKALLPDLGEYVAYTVRRREQAAPSTAPLAPASAPSPP